MKRIPTLDGWRGVAILLVLACHAAVALRGVVYWPHAQRAGEHGVTIFFVLSGFLITSRLIAEEEAHGSISLRSFYARRFFRLMPCAWTYLACASILIILSGESVTAIYLLPCLLFFRNYVDISGTHPATGHFWSLSIEEQFYLIWPSLLVLAGRRGAPWIAIAGAVCVAAYRFRRWANLRGLPLQATLGTQYRADALLIGCAAALLLPAMRPYLRGWLCFPLLGFLVICFSSHRGLIPLHESAAIALLLATTSENPSNHLGRVLDWRPLAYIGKLSYSLYVWQQIFLIFVHTERRFLISLMALPAVAFVSYELIERPFVRYGGKYSRRDVDNRWTQQLEGQMPAGGF
jgi:peptidoglycan/LPS O-acetylase OafA/YrhL